MRILLLVAAAFGFIAAPAHAASEADVVSLPATPSLYCAGGFGSVALHVLAMHLSMREKDVAWMEQMGDVSCRFIDKRDVWFVDESRMRTTRGSRSECVRFDQYRLEGDNTEARYRLSTGTELYRWEWVECRK